MMEGLKEALQYVVGLGNDSQKTEVLEIHGKTYANRQLIRYGSPERAEPVRTSSLVSMVEYIARCNHEFPADLKMLIHVVDPKTVRLISGLDKERKRECLFECRAETSEFDFGYWYDQERFLIELQANFQPNPDLNLLLKFSGNVEKQNTQSYSDDGTTQVATARIGVASKSDVVVPNPVTLIPYRTFQEVDQPASQFVFRLGNKEEPTFALFEAENNIWKNDAVSNIKLFFEESLAPLPEEILDRIMIIG